MSSLGAAGFAKAASLIPISTIFSSIEVSDEQPTILSSSLLPIPTNIEPSSSTALSDATFSLGGFGSSAISGPIPLASSSDTSSVVFQATSSSSMDASSLPSETVQALSSSDLPSSTHTLDDSRSSTNVSQQPLSTNSINPPPATDSQDSSLSLPQPESTITSSQDIILPIRTTPVPPPSQDQTASASVPDDNESLTTPIPPSQLSATEQFPGSTTGSLDPAAGTTTLIPIVAPSTAGDDSTHGTTSLSVGDSHTEGGIKPTPTPNPGGDGHTEGGTQPTPTPIPGGDGHTEGETKPTPTPGGGDDHGGGVLPTITPLPNGNSDHGGGTQPTPTHPPPPPGGVEGSASVTPIPPVEGSGTQTTTSTTTTTTSSELPTTATPAVIYRKVGTDDAAATAFQNSLPAMGVQNVDPWVFVNGWVYGWHGMFNDSVSAALSRDPIVSFVMPDGVRRAAIPEPLPEEQRTNNSADGAPPASQRTSAPMKLRAVKDLKEVEPAEFQIMGSKDPEANLLKLSRSKRMDVMDSHYTDYTYPKNIGDGSVYIVIIDSGLDPRLPEVIAYQKRAGTEIVWLENDMATEPSVQKDADQGIGLHGSCVFYHAVSPTFGAAKNAKVVVIRDDGPRRVNARGDTITLDFNVFARALQLTAKWAQDHGGGPKIIINISSVMLGNTATEQASIDQMLDNLMSTGVLVVVAAGNDGDEFDGDGNRRTPDQRQINESFKKYHDKYDSFMLVGSTDDDDGESSFTSHEANDGKTRIDVWAQGRGIQCPNDVGASLPTHPDEGTSFSSPQVAGIAAVLMLSKKPPTSAKALKKKIMDLAWARVKGGPRVAYNGIWGSNRRCFGLLPRQGQLMHDGTGSSDISASSDNSTDADTDTDTETPDDNIEQCSYVDQPTTLSTITTAPSTTIGTPTPISCSPVNQDPLHHITSAYCVCSSSVTLPEQTGATIPGYTWPQPNCAYTELPTTTTFTPTEQPNKPLTTYDCRVYYENPDADHQIQDCFSTAIPTPTTQAEGYCSFQHQPDHNEYEVNGKRWTEDQMQPYSQFKDAVSHCGLITQDNFVPNMGANSFGYQWSFTFWSIVGQRNCVGNALRRLAESKGVTNGKKGADMKYDFGPDCYGPL